MSLIELVRGLFPFTVMIALIIADGVRLFHSINLLTKDNGIAALLAVVGILAYILLVYRKSEVCIISLEAMMNIISGHLV